MLQQESTAGCHCHLWGSGALDGCFGAENTDSATLLAAFGTGACPEPGCAVCAPLKLGAAGVNECLGVPWCCEGRQCLRVGDPPLLLLQEEQSSPPHTYLLSFSQQPVSTEMTACVFCHSLVVPHPAEA